MDRFRTWLGPTPGNVFAPYVIGSLVTAALVALALAVALAAGLPRVYVWSLGATTLAVAVFFVILFAVIARKEAGQVSALLTGEIWARWSYPLADEERLAAEEWARTRAMVRQTVSSALLAGAIAGGTFALSGLGVGWAVAFGGGIAGLLLLIGLVIYLRGRSRYERRRARTRQVVFGPMAVLHNGACIPLWGTKTRLQNVAVERLGTGDATDSSAGQVLRFERLVERRSTASTSSGWWSWLDLFVSHRYWATMTTTVSIPTGLAAGAEALAERYRHRYAIEPDRGAPPHAAEQTPSGLAARPS